MGTEGREGGRLLQQVEFAESVLTHVPADPIPCLAWLLPWLLAVLVLSFWKSIVDSQPYFQRLRPRACSIFSPEL